MSKNSKSPTQTSRAALAAQAFAINHAGRRCRFAWSVAGPKLRFGTVAGWRARGDEGDPRLIVRVEATREAGWSGWTSIEPGIDLLVIAPVEGASYRYIQVDDVAVEKEEVP